MPLDTITVLIIQNCQAGLIIKLLQAFYSQSTLVLHLFQFSGFDPSKVVWLGFFGVPLPTPECEPAWNVCWWDPLVAISPEPPIDVYRL